MLYSIISSMVTRLVGDSIVSSIIMAFIKIFLDNGSEMVQPALDYIKEAASLPLTNTERFLYVQDKLMKQFPDIGESILNQVIEAAYNAWKGRAL